MQKKESVLADYKKRILEKWYNSISQGKKKNKKIWSLKVPSIATKIQHKGFLEKKKEGEGLEREEERMGALGSNRRKKHLPFSLKKVEKDYLPPKC